MIFFVFSQTKYFYKSVLDHYKVVIVVKEYKNAPPPKRPFKVSWFESATANQLVHHRLDVIPASRMCKHFNQLATLGNFIISHSNVLLIYLFYRCWFVIPECFLFSITHDFPPLDVFQFVFSAVCTKVYGFPERQHSFSFKSRSS